MLWFILAVVLLLILLGLLPVRLDLLLQAGRATNAILSITINILFFKFDWEIQVGKFVQGAIDHFLKRWDATGAPVKVPLQQTLKRWPTDKIQAALGGPLRRLGRQATCRHFAFHAEVGGRDAMESALLTGFGYSVVGTGLGLLSTVVRVMPDAPAISVSPNFELDQPSLRVRAHCIIGFRLGEAIRAGAMILFRLLRDREIRTWALHSWRRKGVEGDVGASDSGADEDGHGKP